MGVAMEDHLDLLVTVLADYPKGEFEVMWTYQRYEFNKIFDTKKLIIDGGTSVKRNVVLDHTGQAKFRRMFDTDTAAVGYVHKQIDVPWAQLSTQYSWDEVELLAQKNSVKGYISLIQTRVNDALWAWADLVEESGWQAPTSATDTLFPYGIPYYLNKLDSGISDGFNGGTITFRDASTSTVCAGLDSATNAKWKNYAATYTTVDNTLLKKFRKAFRLTRFYPPRFINNPGADAITDRLVYTPGDAYDALGDLLDKKDDKGMPIDLLGSVKVRINENGVPFVNGHPVIYIPYLDNDSDNPIYTVDWTKLRVVVQDGYWMEEKPARVAPMQHTVLEVFVDGRCCVLCTNRRTAGFVLHLAQ